MASLRDRQTNALKRMLNRPDSQTEAEEAASSPADRILIYDDLGENIILTSICMEDLCKYYVADYMHLLSVRSSASEMLAIYLCAPTNENINRIKRDLEEGVYNNYHLNFISPISTEMVRDLKYAALLGGVEDTFEISIEYLNFIALENDLFVLRHQKNEAMTYYTINRDDVEDEEMKSNMGIIVDCLFSVLVNLGTVPAICCPRGYATAETVAKMIDEKLRNANKNLFKNQCTTSRPLLIVLDRNIDMVAPLRHAPTHQALMHDILNVELSQLIVKENIEEYSFVAEPCIHKLYNDHFWFRHKDNSFALVINAIWEQRNIIKKDAEELLRYYDKGARLSTSDSTVHLENGVSSAGELRQMGQLINAHMLIRIDILNIILQRRWNTFCKLEEKIISNQSLGKRVLRTIANPKYISVEEKMRLAIIYYICTKMSNEEYYKLEAVLIGAGCYVSPLAYTKRLRSKIVETQNRCKANNNAPSTFFKRMNQGLSSIGKVMKNLVVKKYNSPVLNIVHRLMESKQSFPTADYCYLDPNQLKDTKQTLEKRPQFQEVIVFMVGGGNYVEYQSLMNYIKQQNDAGKNKRVIYGSTSFTNPHQYLVQFSALKREEDKSW